MPKYRQYLHITKDITQEIEEIQLPCFGHITRRKNKTLKKEVFNWTQLEEGSDKNQNRHG
jgi:hypothetical protein